MMPVRYDDATTYIPPHHLECCHHRASGRCYQEHSKQRLLNAYCEHDCSIACHLLLPTTMGAMKSHTIPSHLRSVLCTFACHVHQLLPVRPQQLHCLVGGTSLHQVQVAVDEHRVQHALELRLWAMRADRAQCNTRSGAQVIAVEGACRQSTVQH